MMEYARVSVHAVEQFMAEVNSIKRLTSNLSGCESTMAELFSSLDDLVKNCEKSLHEIAKMHNFSDFLYLGKSERISQKEVRPAIMADSVEAVIAAIFLDGGLEPAKNFIIKNLAKPIENATQHIGQKDYKTVLQEILQKNGNVDIEYEIIDERGPDHEKLFTAEVKVEDKVLATGEGKSKKLAEMQAAQKALENLK